MHLSIFLSFIFYLGTLAITQTSYGGRFLTLRWFALAVLGGVTIIFWVSGRIPRKDQLANRGAPHFTILYLFATLLSVGVAENYLYSGLRWLSHAMLLITFMFILRGFFNVKTTKQLVMALKSMTLALMLISFIYPAPPRIFENPYFRGAMGDSNSLGHVAAICALLFLHGAITSQRQRWRIFQFCVAVGAVGILVLTWARSSMIAFLIGFVILNYYHGLTRSYLSKAFVLLGICFLIASPWIQTHLIDFVAKDREGKLEREDSQILAIISKGGSYKQGPTFEKVMETRSFLWSEAWEGFKQKPFLGWGFGANRDVQREWTIRPTSGGMVRDLTNDILFTLEGSGIIGFLAYIGLMISILKQSLSRQQIIRVRKKLKERVTKGENPISYCPLARDHQQAILYVISISLFALFQTDGSAFSAGSLISAIFWVCAGAAGGLRAEAVATERIMASVQHEAPMPAGHKFRHQNPKWERRAHTL